MYLFLFLRFLPFLARNTFLEQIEYPANERVNGIRKLLCLRLSGRTCFIYFLPWPQKAEENFKKVKKKLRWMRKCLRTAKR